MRRTLLPISVWLLAVWSFEPALVWAGEEPTPEQTEEAAEEAAPDPTRGQWPSSLDPWRDAEDRVTDGQKWLEDRTKIHVGAGYTQAYTWSLNNPPSGKPLAFHSLEYQNEGTPMLGQLSLSRPSEGWFIPGFGAKIDAGKIPRRIKADWNGDGIVGQPDDWEVKDFEIQEAYLTWAVPETSPILKGLALKGGKFVTLLGAEVIEPWLNYNYSRSYMFSWSIPFTHTGGLATYPVTEKLSLTGGVIVGWDNVADNNTAASFIGNATYVVTDELTFSANGIIGPEQTDRDGPQRGIVDFVATIKPLPELTFLLNYDWGREEDVVNGTLPGTWQGFALVGNYDFTDRFSSAFRGEWFDDRDGIRTGLAQTLWELTFDLKYRITQHFYTRVEYRHDESSSPDAFPADDGNRLLSGQDIVSVEWTYLFN